MISKVICKMDLSVMKMWKLSGNFQISSMKYYRTHAVGQQLFYLTQTFVNGIVNM